MGCRGLHCEGCGDGNGGLVLAVLAVLAIVGAVVHAIWHQLVEAFEIAALVLGSAAALAVLAGVACLAVRIRARQLAHRAPRTVPMPARVVRLGAESGREAIEARRWPLAGRWEQVNPSNDRRTS